MAGNQGKEEAKAKAKASKTVMGNSIPARGKKTTHRGVPDPGINTVCTVSTKSN